MRVAVAFMCSPTQGIVSVFNFFYESKKVLLFAEFLSSIDAEYSLKMFTSICMSIVLKITICRITLIGLGPSNQLCVPEVKPPYILKDPFLLKFC